MSVIIEAAFARGDCIADIAEVDHARNFRRRHVGDELPHRLPGATSRHIPGGIDDRPDGHVHDALFGAQPAQLGVIGEGSRKGPQPGANGGDVQADDQVPERPDGLHLHIVAAADGEHESASLQLLRVVGPQHHIAGRVVRVGIHGIRAIELQ